MHITSSSLKVALFLFIFTSLSSIYSCSQLENLNEVAAKSHRIFYTEEFLKMILGYSIDNLEVRIVSKRFKETFDQACMFEVCDHDPQFKTLAISSNNMIPRIPLQIPLATLLFKYLKPTLVEIKEELDEKYPIVNVVEGTKRAYKLRQRRDRMATEKFIDLVSQFFIDNYYDPTNNEVMASKDLYHFYKQVRVLIPRDYLLNFLKLIRLPIDKLLNQAARGTFPDLINEELLVEFRSILPPKLIFESLKARRLDLVKLMLSFNPEANRMVDIRDEKARRPIHFAAHYGDIELVQILMDLGANFKTCFDSKQEMPIHKAAKSGHLDIVQLLYENGARVNGNKYAPSPIMNAIKHEHTNIVNFILTETNYEQTNDYLELIQKPS